MSLRLRLHLAKIPVALAALLSGLPAHAVLDVADRGPRLEPGGFALRVTNAGIVGNAFFDVGLSSDPSFEFPAHSGQELLNYGALWVGARAPSGNLRVSGGPILEWRPTLDPADRVRSADHGRLGSRRLFDDDNDGRLDEERLNGRDDDGDNEIDEDLGFWSKQLLAADYVDDRPEASQYVYEGGESHEPLHLSVHQEALGWGTAGYTSIAGLEFRITNHGTETLRDVYVGMFADLDSRLRSDRSGHLDDRVTTVTGSRGVTHGGTVVTGTQPFSFSCVRTIRRTVPAVADGRAGSRLPLVALVPLDHTTDPLALLDPGVAHARAPGSVAFRTAVFSRTRVPGQGGVPSLDLQRYAALSGTLEQAPVDSPDDYAVLVSCGPFRTLAPGQTIAFDAALVAASTPDSLADAIAHAIHVHYGVSVNLVPDVVQGADPTLWNEGESGTNGHEACIEPPPGVTFDWDPHCPDVLSDPGGNIPPPASASYGPGRCVWTDADCDKCTGANGRETVLRWLDPGALPPPPETRTVPLDHGVRIEWDNTAEILVDAGVAGPPGGRFVGYRLYKVQDWRDRRSLLPPPESWSLLAAFGPDSLHGEQPLSAITDSSVRDDRILYRRPHYPVGRYRFTDANVLNGFDYVYIVTTLVDVSQPGGATQRHETPLVSGFERRVTPQAAARDVGNGVWVVPNPFRARAAWDRPPIGGDGLTTHIDFMGLPRAPSTIKIFTLAGDLVQVLVHDGSAGDGEAEWDLVSRSGQDVESGIYLFVVESALGRQIGRFVVIR